MNEKIKQYFSPLNRELLSSEEKTSTLLINLTIEDIKKNMNDLKDKNLITIDEDLSLYEY